MFSTFQKLTKGSEPYLAFRSFDTLNIGSHEIQQFILRETRYGTKLAVQMNDSIYILPDRFSKNITTEAEVNELNTSRYNLIFQGRDEKKRNRLLIEFIEAPRRITPPTWEYPRIHWMDAQNTMGQGEDVAEYSG